MIKIDIKNNDILSTLYDYTDWLFSQDLSSFDEVGSDLDPDKETSEEELYRVMKDPNHIGFPLKARGINLTNFLTDEKELKDKVSEFSFNFKRQLGAKHDALHMYYPENGMISWHTNENAPGKNLILSYSTDGLGYFRYRDPSTGEIITIQDEKGWNAKMGEFVSGPGVIWHCARNYGPRLTISYIIENNAMWEDVKEELEEE